MIYRALAFPAALVRRYENSPAHDKRGAKIERIRFAFWLREGKEFEFPWRGEGKGSVESETVGREIRV